MLNRNKDKNDKLVLIIIWVLLFAISIGIFINDTNNFNYECLW